MLSCSTPKKTSQVPTSSLQSKLVNGEHILIENQTISEELVFTNYLASNPVSSNKKHCNTIASITYKNCIFEEKVAGSIREKGQTVATMFMNNLSFIGCTFKKSVDFSECSIYGLVDFSGSLFQGDVNFQNTTFYQKVFFNKVQFYKESKFQNTFFYQKVNFSNSEFFGVSSFQESTFTSALIMNVCKFSEYADFSLANFNNSCFFNYAEFYKKVVFSNANFSNRSEFIGANLFNANFEEAFFERIPIFSNCKVNKLIQFKNTSFMMDKPNMDYLSTELIEW